MTILLFAESSSVLSNHCSAAVICGLEAKLKHISADSIEDKETEETYYLIRLQTDETHLINQGEKLDIIPGMVVDVDILTGKKTVLDYLLKPITKAREKALRER